MTDDPPPLPYPAGSDTGPSAGEAATPRALPALSLHTSRSALLPMLIHNYGPQASKRYLEFFTAQIRNTNTRAAYARAATRFFAWCQNAAGVNQLIQIEPIHVAAWIEGRAAEVSAPTVKQELAALRKLFDWLVIGQVLPASPATFVRGPSHSVKIGTTPVLTVDQARVLLSSIPKDTVAGHRDRTLIALMIYSFARISAALALDVGDLYRELHRLNIRLNEKGGKRHHMPCHHTLDAYLVQYMTLAGLGPAPTPPSFKPSPAIAAPLPAAASIEPRPGTWSAGGHELPASIRPSAVTPFAEPASPPTWSTLTPSSRKHRRWLPTPIPRRPGSTIGGAKLLQSTTWNASAFRKQLHNTPPFMRSINSATMPA